ncbi:MAG: AI-2E family transporter [Ferruginibacter sp.]
MPAENSNAQADKLPFSKKLWIAGGIILAYLVFFLLFKALFSVLLLALAAILIAVYFHGLANIIHRKLHIPKRWSLGISILFNVILLIAFFWFVGARLQSQVSELSDTLPKAIEKVKVKMDSTSVGSKILGFVKSSGDSEKTLAVAKKFFSSGFGILSDLYIVILMASFFTASPSTYKKGFTKLLPSKAKGKAESLLNDLSHILKKWIKGQVFGFFFIAVFTGVGLWIIGMPLILTLAIMAGVLNFVPNFGPLIALIPAGLLGLTISPTTSLVVMGMYIFVQIIQSAVTQPLIQQKMVNIPPVLTIFAQVAMGLLAGFWGVLLAAPIVAIIMTVVNKLYLDPQQQD